MGIGNRMTIFEGFSQTVLKHPDKAALMYRKEGKYVGITYEELMNSIGAVAEGIKKLGIGKGDKVGIFSYNRPEWVIADLAVLKIGGIVVPIYHAVPSSHVKHIINDSNTKLLFVETVPLLVLVKEIKDECPTLRKIVVFESSEPIAEHDILQFDSLRHEKCKSIASEESPDVSANDVATIVYTSGSMGEPKGVILTHKNITSNAFSVMRKFRVTSEDIFLSFLPLCHMFERTCAYYATLFAGGTIAYVKDMSAVAEDIREVRPTILITVPRLIEKVYESVEKRVSQGLFIRRGFVSLAVKRLNHYANLKHRGAKIPLFLRIRRPLYDVLVASKFRKIAGGRLRALACAGAPLDRKISKLLYILGFNIVEAYGLTEASPAVCSNTVEENELGTVGKPLDDVEVAIGENDEILVKGYNVMVGYLNMPEETSKVIDQDGWLHTGDKGRFDEKGNLIITGRIKEIIVTSYGKNIVPTPIEMEIARNRYIDQIMLCGDKKKHVAALIVPNRESVLSYAEEIGIRFDDYQSLLQRDE
ncbi:long-chain fatty acid--CoA ligase, partial [candidate division TA06 bacterium]